MSIKRISVLNLCHVLKPFVKSTPALVRDLLSKKSLFVGQLYADKSLALRFTTDLQTVNYYSTGLSGDRFHGGIWCIGESLSICQFLKSDGDEDFLRLKRKYNFRLCAYC